MAGNITKKVTPEFYNLMERAKKNYCTKLGLKRMSDTKLFELWSKNPEAFINPKLKLRRQFVTKKQKRRSY